MHELGLLAVFSAIFVAATVLLAKAGAERIDSNLAMAIRTSCVIFVWVIAFSASSLWRNYSSGRALGEVRAPGDIIKTVLC